MTSALDPRPIFLVTGLLLLLLGVAMLLPALIDLIAGHELWQVFAFSAMFTIVVGTALYLANQGAPRNLSTRQALIMTVLAWVAMVAFGAIPFYLSGVTEQTVDAVFESMSGLTTTGATVITGLDSKTPGLLFWRALLEWMGGLGIIVMAIAVLPMLQIGGMQLFKAEAFDTPEKILPRATQISTSITAVYVTFTAICALALLIAGMKIDDAVIHAMTTVATGGFSSKDASVGHFESLPIELIIMVFMIAGSIPFLLYVQALRGSLRPLLTDSQVLTFLGFLVVAILAAWMIARASGEYAGLEALRRAAFNVISIMTGTGFASADYGKWGPAAVALFFILMFIGGCAGSTSCGIKIFRFEVLYQIVRRHLYEIMYPNGVFHARYHGRIIGQNVMSSVMSFFFIFFVSFVLTALALRLTGLDMITSLSGAGTALANVGPGLGGMIGPAGNFEGLGEAAKWILCAAMLVGRLEFFTILVLFLPSFWTD